MDQQRILIADDDDDLRDLLREAFVNAGYEVHEALDGADLQNLLKQARQSNTLPDVVLSDYRMPSATGLEVLSWASENLPQVPFIIFSAFAAPHIRERALQLGAAAVLEKPVDMRVLKEQVARVIRTRSI